MQPLWPLQTLGPLQLVLALEPIVINITATANKEIYVITAIKSIQIIMTITANAVITAIMAITANAVISAIRAISSYGDYSQCIHSCNY